MAPKTYFLIIKINTVPGHVSDISAKKTSLAMADEDVDSSGYEDHVTMILENRLSSGCLGEGDKNATFEEF